MKDDEQWPSILMTPDMPYDINCLVKACPKCGKGVVTKKPVLCSECEEKAKDERIEELEKALATALDAWKFWFKFTAGEEPTEESYIRCKKISEKEKNGLS